MIRILQCVNYMHRAGLETMLMNYYRNINRDKIQFDFLTHRPNRSDYDDEIESLGGKVFYAPRLYPQNYPAYFRWMRLFFREHPEYIIMHSHIDSMSYLPLLAGKFSKVPIRIAHSHNTAIDRDFKYILKQCFRYGINSVSTHRLACGEEAGKFLFRNKDFKVIPNAIDAKRFLFSKEVRSRKRLELNLTDKFVVGHIGRIVYQKNHKFLISIFNELQKKCPNSVLLLIGVGELEEDVRKQVTKLGIESKVKFLGNRSDVYELYQVMDAFVLPSFFEGIPVVGIEAQYADLPCFFSDKISSEVKFNKKSQFLPLTLKAEEWAECILQTTNIINRRKIEDIQNSIYNIDHTYKMLEEYYLGLVEKAYDKNKK